MANQRKPSILAQAHWDPNKFEAFAANRTTSSKAVFAVFFRQDIREVHVEMRANSHGTQDIQVAMLFKVLGCTSRPNLPLAQGETKETNVGQ